MRPDAIEPVAEAVEPTLAAAVRQGAVRLAAAGVPAARRDALVLAAHLLGVDPAEAERRALLGAAAPAGLDDLLAARARRVPLQHLVGEAHFRHLTLAVGPGVFVPRPETEVLVELALQALRERSVARPPASSTPSGADTPEGVQPLGAGEALGQAELAEPARPTELAPPRGAVEVTGPRGAGERPDATKPLGMADAAEPPCVVDLCTGSGAIAIALATEYPGAEVWAVELSEQALGFARRNIATVDADVRLVHGDATAEVPELASLLGRVDLVTTNPPYIPEGAVPIDPEVRDYDPPMALYGGGDGLEIPMRLIDRAAALLRPGGVLLVEHAEVQGEEVVRRLQADPRWSHPADELDLTGRPRVARALRAGLGAHRTRSSAT